MVHIPVIGPDWPENAPRLNCWVKPKGELATISTTETKFIAYIEFPEDGVPRANHFHKEKEEYLYLISGRVRCYFRRADALNETPNEIDAFAGDLISVQPGWSHAYLTIEPGHAIEFSPTPFAVILEDTFSDKVI